MNKWTTSMLSSKKNAPINGYKALPCKKLFELFFFRNKPFLYILMRLENSQHLVACLNYHKKKYIEKSADKLIDPLDFSPYFQSYSNRTCSHVRPGHNESLLKV